MRCATGSVEIFYDTVSFQGVPMLCGGDEWGRTQNGNNNCLLPGQRDQLV
jgi:pullulanase/glycogen debranching enzyme